MKLNKEQFLALNPCKKSLDFAKSVDFDLHKGWNTCERGDWLIFLLRNTCEIDTWTWAKLAKGFADHVKHLNGAYAAAACADYAADAAVHAYAYAYAASAAADAAHAAAAAVHAAHAAAADTADYATSCASVHDYAAAADACAAAVHAERKWQADYIRSIIDINNL